MRPTEHVKDWSAEQILDHVYQHFIVEGNPWCGQGSNCFYNKTGCAVGCLLTQEESEVLESKHAGRRIDDIFIDCVKDSEVDNIVKDLRLHRDLLLKLQSSHDSYAFYDINLFKENFGSEIKKIGLSYGWQR